jgi:hypothetical protein
MFSVALIGSAHAIRPTNPLKSARFWPIGSVVK